MRSSAGGAEELASQNGAGDEQFEVRYREEQRELSTTAGTRWRDSGYVFTTADGAPL